MIFKKIFVTLSIIFYTLTAYCQDSTLVLNNKLEINSDTTTTFLQLVADKPVLVLRMTDRSCGLHLDAAYKFLKSQDDSLQKHAIIVFSSTSRTSYRILSQRYGGFPTYFTKESINTTLETKPEPYFFTIAKGSNIAENVYFKTFDNTKVLSQA